VINSGDKILGIVAHPDDEFLWLWSVYQRQDIEKYLVVICSDLNRKGPHRRAALQEVCQQENIKLHECLDVDNNFGNLPTRRASYLLTDAVKEIEDTISKAISDIKPNYVASHNICGEYGHMSHRLLFELVSQNENAKNVIFTDIVQKSNHRSSDAIPQSVRDAYYGKQISKQIQHLDLDFYARCKRIYEDRQAFTWCYPPIETCNLFIINEDN
jgi:hypothetical protein